MNRQVALSTVAALAGALFVSSTTMPLLAQSGQRASAAKPAASAPASKDAAFIRTAADDGMAEVDHGQLATQNASSADVKQFAQRMVDDHGKANDELTGLASKKSVTLPAEMSAKHKAMHEKLAKLKGDAFDAAYMSHMVTAHAQAVALFQKEAKGGADPDAKSWAAKTLPTLQEHHKMAQSVSAKIKGGSKSKPK
jgi:putative membrane protein